MEEGREASAEGGIGLFEFGDEAAGCGGEGATEFGFVERADQGGCEWVGESGGEAVDAAGVDGVFSEAEAGKGEDVIAEFTDPVLGLPGFVTFDA